MQTTLILNQGIMAKLWKISSFDPPVAIEQKSNKSVGNLNYLVEKWRYKNRKVARNNQQYIVLKTHSLMGFSKKNMK